MAALMWCVEVFDQVSGLLDRDGIEARDTDGLVGIVAAPFLHAGVGHVAANTLPLLALGLLIAFGGALRVVLASGRSRRAGRPAGSGS
jgi:membrane associated rhomboid family serine protease